MLRFFDIFSTKQARASNFTLGTPLTMLRSLLFALLLFYPAYVLLDSSVLHAFNWTMWTPGDTVDNSTQFSLVKGYHPDQPIPFNHKLHAGDRQIPCKYCHSSADRSPVAGVPPVNTCMNCHSRVGKTEPIQKIRDAFKNNKPIVWTKVHDLPDYVRFSHKVHMHAKGADGKALLACQTCHGPVETMGTAEQWAPLQMGWCIECHNRVKIPATKDKAAVKNAPTSCNTCHF